MRAQWACWDADYTHWELALGAHLKMKSPTSVHVIQYFSRFRKVLTKGWSGGGGGSGVGGGCNMSLVHVVMFNWNEKERWCVWGGGRGGGGRGPNCCHRCDARRGKVMTI